MLKSHLKVIAVSLLISSAAPLAGHAQDSNSETELIKATVESQTTKKGIKRVIEAVPYWVESDQLRVRDNPYAGDVIGMLEIGQEVKVHQTFDNWVLISGSGEKEQWVNKDFLSNSPVTWANYKFDSRGSNKLAGGRFGDARYDIKKKRIKIKEAKGVRVYAADIKRFAGGQKIVISRHDFRAGAYYEKRMVKCDENAASHVKMLGEGYTVMMMEADPRKQRMGVPMAEQDQIENEDASVVDKAIAEFTCKRDKL